MDGDWLEPTRTSGLEETLRRLIRLGSSALSSTELVALLLRRDSPTRAAELMEHGLRWLLTQPPEALTEFHGLEPMEVARVLACGELARRLHQAPDDRPRLVTPNEIYTWARPRFVGLKREEFHVLCLNNRNILLRHVRVTEGSVDQCQVDPREAFAPAVASRASALVLIHNHPSGDPEPSVHDVTLTRHLKEAARLLCIRLVDHLVLGDAGFVSMLQRGLLGVDAPLPSSRLHAP